MSWEGARGSEVTLLPSASESARFGHSVERLTVGADWQQERTRAELGRRLRELMASSGARTIILRYPTGAPFIPQELGDHGRAVYPAGSLVYWERVAPFPPGSDGITMVQAPGIAAEVISQIREVLADSFTGYINHYSANPLIGKDAITDGYLEWAESTVLDPENRVFLSSVDGRAAGVATVECAPGSAHWEIQLAGMISSVQGKGHYAQLVGGVLASAGDQGVSRVVISTQAHNVRVQRAWARLGFVPMASIDTVHLVSSGEGR